MSIYGKFNDMSYFKIANGTVYDPTNGVDGQVRDLWIEDGKVVAPPVDGNARPDRTLDATGYVVMPGGVDMHCHIAGPKVNVARKLRPEDKRKSPMIHRSQFKRSGTTGSVPSTFATGYLYAGLGYTTALDAAIPPLYARHAHEEFGDTPIIDKGFLTLIGNNHYVMQQIAEGELGRLDAYCGWLVNAVKSFGLKVVNPGGIEEWKDNARHSIDGLDSQVAQFNVTPRQILREIAASVDRLKLPHSIHLHCNNLGMPGNWKTTLDTMQSLEGHRGHLAHVQFHSYGGGDADDLSFSSATAKLVDYVKSHPNLTVDVGHVNFGTTTSLTGDGPLGYYLHKVTGNKWFSGDTEMETGCGIVPIEYRDKNLVHSIQWAIGLEWYLMMDDPWRIAMSTDHPNGGAFMRYPELIHLLMKRDFRREAIRLAHPKLIERTSLMDLDREYSLYEIAIITRASPARILGLKKKGHLGIGADADVTIYSPSDDVQKMFDMPRWVIKAGQIIIEDGEVRADIYGKTFLSEPTFDPDGVPDIQKWFEQYYTIQFANYPVDEHYVTTADRIACTPGERSQ